MPHSDPEKRKAYNREYMRKWYPKNRELQIARARASKDKTKVWFRAWKKTLKCSRCPEHFYACLDFHHKDGDEKERLISQMVDSGFSKAAILREAAKCIVLCANCHRKKHHGCKK